MSEREQSYGKQLLSVAPLFAAKSVLGDLPKAGLEYAIEKRTGGDKASMASLFKKGLTGRGSGRALGALLGGVTAPLYLSGIKNLSSNKKSDQKKGLAQVGASAAGYAGLKGLIEGGREARQGGAKLPKALALGAEKGAIKSILKTPMALALGLSVASGRRKSSEGDKPSVMRKMLLPALTGGLLAGGTRAAEVGISAALRRKGLRAAYKKMVPAAAGGAAGGALGGLALSAVTDYATKMLQPKKPKKVKTASALAIAGGLAIGAAKGRAALTLARADIVAGAAKGLGKLVGSGRRGSRFNALVSKGIKAKDRARARQIGIGIREGVAGRSTAGLRSTLALGAAMPDLLIQRGVGRQLGAALRGVPEPLRPTVLKNIQAVSRNKELRTTLRGSKTPLVTELGPGIDIALGKSPLYKNQGRLGRAWEKASLFGRGVHSKRGGLPRAGRVDRQPKLRSRVEAGVAVGLSVGAALVGGPMILPAARLGDSALSTLPWTAGIMNAAASGAAARGLHRGLGVGKHTRVSRLKRRLFRVASEVGDHPGDLGEGFGKFLKTAAKKQKEFLPAPVQQHKTGIPAMKPWFAPYPHQKAAIDKLYANRGKLILAHQTGTGKTASAIYGFERLRHDGKAKGALVVVPSGLRENFATSGIEGFTTSDYQIVGSNDEKKTNRRVVRPDEVQPGKPYTVVSYSTFRRDPVGFMQRSGSDTLILDEFHKARNEKAKIFKAVWEARKLAANFIGLTASPINNDPGELASLLTLSEGNRVMSPSQFRRAFVETVGHTKGFSGKKKKVQDLKNHGEMLQLTYPRMDYVTSKDIKSKVMPRKDVTDVPVAMSKEQYDHYQLALDKLGPVKSYLMRRDDDLSMPKANMVFTKLLQARQVSNSMGRARKSMSNKQSAKVTPKIKKIVEDTVQHLKEDPNHKVVVYSNLVRGGVDVLDAGLRDAGLDPALFVGKGTDINGRKVTGPSRQKGVKDYKAGKKRVIILSSAGAEGLDLKNSTAFYAADGHFNPERIHQAEARAQRLGGQQFRKPENRRVDVRRYRSVTPESAKPGFFGRLVGRKTPQTTDEWIYNVADRKERKTKSFKKTMREPHRYIRKYKTAAGNTVYVYPKGHKAKPTTAGGWKFWE